MSVMAYISVWIYSLTAFVHRMVSLTLGLMLIGFHLECEIKKLDILV